MGRFFRGTGFHNIPGELERKPVQYDLDSLELRLAQTFQLGRNFMKFSVLSGLDGAVGCGYRWKHCAKPVWEAWRNIRKTYFFCEIYFSGLYGALIPLTDSKNRFKSPHIAAFSIGNPIQNLQKIQQFGVGPLFWRCQRK